MWGGGLEAQTVRVLFVHAGLHDGLRWCLSVCAAWQGGRLVSVLTSLKGGC